MVGDRLACPEARCARSGNGPHQPQLFSVAALVCGLRTLQRATSILREATKVQAGRGQAHADLIGTALHVTFTLINCQPVNASSTRV